jgi:pyruvate formate lyase activating enzyme
MIIGGLQKTTLIDYPGKVAAIIFTSGCNMKCHYCYNPEMRNFSPKITEKDFFDFLDKRKEKLDAITITGGEPTAQADLCEFIKKIKDRGFLVKVDTNGTNPSVLKRLFDAKIADYVAMDIKAPLEKYREVANCFVNEAAIKDSIEIIISRAPDYEFRTTIVKGQLQMEDMENIGKLIKGAKRHYSQKFMPTENLNDRAFKLMAGYSDDEMEKIKTIMGGYVKESFIR